MMNIVYYVAASIDGFVARTNDDISWLDPFNSPDEDYGFHSFYAGMDVLIMGAGTFQKALSFGEWPHKDKPTYVLSSRSWESPHDSVHFHKGSIDALVTQLRQQGVRNAWLVGGGKLASSFLKAGAFDELILSTIPVLLGNGIPLFERQEDFHTFRLSETKTYASGVVQNKFVITK